MDCEDGRLDKVDVKWKEEAAVCVVMAAGGYPKTYEKGDVIEGLAAAEATGAMVFHAGTAKKGNDIVTDGGRVLGVVATAPLVKDALDKAYAAVETIKFRGAHYRKDIAYRALQRL